MQHRFSGLRLIRAVVPGSKLLPPDESPLNCAQVLPMPLLPGQLQVEHFQNLLRFVQQTSGGVGSFASQPTGHGSCSSTGTHTWRRGNCGRGGLIQQVVVRQRQSREVVPVLDPVGLSRSIEHPGHAGQFEHAQVAIDGPLVDLQHRGNLLRIAPPVTLEQFQQPQQSGELRVLPQALFAIGPLLEFAFHVIVPANRWLRRRISRPSHKTSDR